MARIRDERIISIEGREVQEEQEEEEQDEEEQVCHQAGEAGLLC